MKSNSRGDGWGGEAVLHMKQHFLYSWSRCGETSNEMIIGSEIETAQMF